MNETLNLMERRRSTRVYSDQPVTREERDAILHAAFRAPTAGNQMLYSIIEVEDQALKDRLAVTCDNQPFIAQAPFVLVFLADYQRWYDYFQVCRAPERADELGLRRRPLQVGDFVLAACDALIAAQTAVIAAESLGIGSCYIGDVLENYEEHRRLLDLPPYAMPVAMLCFGYPSKSESAWRSPRFEPRFVCFKDRYQRLNADQLGEMFREREARFKAPAEGAAAAAQNFGQAMYLRKFIAEFSWEMSRSVRKMIEVWEESV